MTSGTRQRTGVARTAARITRASRGGGGTPRRPRLARLPADRPSRRILGMLAIQLVLFSLVAGQLVRVQVIHADEYADRGSAQRTREVVLAARRGRLYDREGDVLATSVDAATIYGDPRAFRPGETPGGDPLPPAGDPDEVARTLARVIDVPAKEIATRLRRDAHFVYLARQLPWSVGEKVSALKLPGIGILTEPSRVYPAGQLAGQIVGFTGIDGDGLHGLELEHDGLLRGRPGRLAVEQAPNGLAIASGIRELSPATPGTDLVLTIDREIQHAAEEAASRAVSEYGARGASVVVLEVGSGDVFAMASAPGYDPNRLDQGDREAWRNRAVTDVYEPGSVQKAITAAAAIEEGIVTPDTEMTVKDHLRVGSKTFRDSHSHAPLDLTFGDVIEQSSNIGTIMVAQQLGAERLARYLDAFGLGRRLGVDFPGEAPGLLMPVDQWWNTSLPTIAIGQGVAVTLLQSASAYATLANDGVAVQPRILRGTVGDDGRLAPVASHEGQPVVSAETATHVRGMLTRVVSGDHGTGGRAAVPGYEVAGKTGTARKPRQDARGYSGEYVASFVGFAPADAPRLVVAVMVDEPSIIWGGVVAAPLFADVMRFSLDHLRIPPTQRAASLADALDEATRQRALAAAKVEGPGTAADDPASPPVGTPAGGDGSPAKRSD